MQIARCLALLVVVQATFATAASAAREEILVSPLALGPVAAGHLQNHEIDLDGSIVVGVAYRASLGHSLHEGVHLGFYEPAAKASPRAMYPRTALRGGQLLHLRILVDNCSPSWARPLAGEIVLEPEASALASVPLVRVPWSVAGVHGNQGECRRDRAVSLLRGFLVGSVIFLLAGALLNSCFLSKRQLALRLKPLRWDGRREIVEPASQDVYDLVHRELRPWRRALAWLRANPLTFSLPGHSYHETVELLLAPRPDASRLALIGHRDLYAALARRPDDGAGRLFASARSGLCFFGVPRGEEIGGLRPGPPRRKLRDLVRIDLRHGENLYFTTRAKGPHRSVGQTGWQL